MPTIDQAVTDEVKPMPRWLMATGALLILALLGLMMLDTGIGAPPPRPEVLYPEGEPWASERVNLGTDQAVPTELDCEGTIDSLTSGSGEFDKITGWLFSPTAAAAPETAHILDSGGLMLGFAITGTGRPDVVRAKGAGAETSGFIGVLKSPAIVTVRLQGTFADGRSCFVDARVPPPS